MSLLEAFYYTFGADADPLDKALKESEKRADQLKNKVSAADEQAAKLGTSFVSLARSAAGLLGVTVTLAGIKALAVTTAETTAALGMQARIMGVNVSTLGAWRKAVTESGGDANAFSSTLGNLARRFRDPEAALLRLSGSLGKMSAYRAHRIGKMLGLDESTIELLRQGRVKVEELIKKQKEMGVITKAQVEQAEKFNLKLRQFKAELDNVKFQISTALIPIFEKLLKGWDKLSAWVSKNKEPLSDFFISLGAVVTAYYLPALARAAIATLATLWPLLLVAAGFVLLGLVVADVVGYLKGMNSVTGELVKKFPELDTVLRNSKTEFEQFGSALKKALTDPKGYLEDLENDIYGLSDSPAWTAVVDTTKWLVNECIGNLKLLFSYILEFFDGIVNGVSVVTTGVADGFNKGIDKVKKWLGIKEKGDNKTELPPKNIQGWEGDYIQPESNTQLNPRALPEDRTYGGVAYLNDLSRNPINAMTGNSISNMRQSNSKTYSFRFDNVEVTTQATDPNAMADGFVDSIRESTVNNFSDGLVA